MDHHHYCRRKEGTYLVKQASFWCEPRTRSRVLAFLSTLLLPPSSIFLLEIGKHIILILTTAITILNAVVLLALLLYYHYQIATTALVVLLCSPLSQRLSLLSTSSSSLSFLFCVKWKHEKRGKRDLCQN